MEGGGAEKENHELSTARSVKMQSIEGIKHCNWFDERLEVCLSTYRLDVDDIFCLYEIYHDLDCAYGGQEGRIYIDYVFDFIQEPSSVYGQWLFMAIGGKLRVEEDRDHDVCRGSAMANATCCFSEFCHVVCFTCMMGKLEQTRFLFSSVAEMRQIGKKEAKVMTEDQWAELIGVMVEYETRRHPTQPAVREYRQYAYLNPSHADELVLFYDDFVQVSLRLLHALSIVGRPISICTYM
jgi:hypothetical protein